MVLYLTKTAVEILTLLLPMSFAVQHPLLGSDAHSLILSGSGYHYFIEWLPLLNCDSSPGVSKPVVIPTLVNN